MARNGWILAILSLTLAGCGGELDTGEEENIVDQTSGPALKAMGSRQPKPAATSYLVQTTDARTSDATPTWKSSFPISSTYTIYFAADIVGVTGHHTATFDVSMPGGLAYQRINVPFAAGATAAAGEQSAEKLKTGYRVWASIPVAGTLIDSSRLTGTWKIDLKVDSVSAVSTTFVLF
jgi:hypothetical protein